LQKSFHKCYNVLTLIKKGALFVGVKDKSKKELQEYIAGRYKRQNEHIKNNYDRISITLPKGTKERILQKEDSINGYVNRLIMQDLEKDS
jgi:hypothetical protein